MAHMVDKQPGIEAIKPFGEREPQHSTPQDGTHRSKGCLGSWIIFKDMKES